LFLVARDQRASVIILGAVYELTKSYDQVFFVIGGVYAVDALVFGIAALLQGLRRQERRLSVTPAGNFRVSRGRAATFRTSTDVNLTVVDSASAAVAVPSPFSTYGALIVTAGTSATAGQSGGGDGGGKANNGERRNQTETATAPSGVHGE